MKTNTFNLKVTGAEYVGSYIIKKVSLLFFLLMVVLPGVAAQETDGFREYQGIFFRISGNGLKSPSYLLGTFHSIPGDFVYSLPDFEEIIASVEQLVAEYNFKEQYRDLPHWQPTRDELDSLYRHITTLYTNKDGSVRSFIDDLSPKRRRQVTDFLSYCGFTDRSSYTYEFIDRNIEKAYRQKQLEDINAMGHDFRIGGSVLDKYLMDSISAQYRLTIIGLDKKDAVHRYSDKKNELETQWNPSTKRKAYSRLLDKDLAYFQKLQKGTSMACRDYFEGDNTWIKYVPSRTAEMKDRNTWWMEQIPGLIQDKPSFIAIGLAHLWDGWGYKGLIPQLQALGYTIERLR